MVEIAVLLADGIDIEPLPSAALESGAEGAQRQFVLGPDIEDDLNRVGREEAGKFGQLCRAEPRGKMFRAEDQCSRPVPGNQATQGAVQLRGLTPQPAIEEVAFSGIEKGGGQGKMRIIVEEGAGD